MESKILHRVRRDSSVDPAPAVHPLGAISKVPAWRVCLPKASVAQIRLLVPVRLPTSDELVGMYTRAEDD